MLSLVLLCVLIHPGVTRPPSWIRSSSEATEKVETHGLAWIWRSMKVRFFTKDHAFYPAVSLSARCFWPISVLRCYKPALFLEVSSILCISLTEIILWHVSVFNSFNEKPLWQPAGTISNPVACLSFLQVVLLTSNIANIFLAYFVEFLFSCVCICQNLSSM